MFFVIPVAFCVGTDRPSVINEPFVTALSAIPETITLPQFSL
jgi:hypothetical protein